ncbi:hypothetical protein [Acidaminobacter hydrogenoformans]|uniref:Uncharacterized protein n=1 Tax=Acidaminobacter hydrogenoformans DSM 2784 TaxID=1120920 RepID=A0A1G5S2Q6_9FIRM|nr:hypothetical protein [Acidaminobacter hydrogenoformans]SCZ80417.1 hypothetical protein SAMN03080599_02260 [Acidaminobacter hydrogenoformans DSM 2784]
MNFDDFVKTHPTCNVVKDSQSARIIYETIIWNDQNRIKMAELSDSEIPALVAVANDIIDYCATAHQCDLDITNDTVKQVIGRMISTAIAPLGYEPAKKKRLPKSTVQTVFKNATVFANTGIAIERIEKQIVPIIK